MAAPPLVPPQFREATVPGRHWRMLEDGRVQCEVCPRLCKLHEGQRGLCFVRARENDGIVLTTYGRSSGFCVDPIEKKPLAHFLPGTPVLSFGTAGCNLTCKFCQNHDMSKSRQMDTLSGSASPLMLAEAAQRLGCRSVAYTYNDPTIFLEYAVDTAIACREKGIRNVAVSAGYVCPAPRAEFYSVMDAVNIDLKAFTEEFYHKLTGSRLETVKETLQYLVHDTDVWVEITNLVIPGHNDSEAELTAMAEWIMGALGPDVPVHFSAFHPDFKMMDVPATPVETLLTARRIAHEAGIRYAYIGNVHHEEADSTWCHQCGAKLIGRDWYRLTHWGLDDTGHCRACGTGCAGRFDGPPGNWGRRRLPVTLSAPVPAG
ncbi:AmmeMemoRadiSam system radical SAM enzyme [Marinibaculum pumilum]|uniref:AmmeMemoRadiSam system radical SAM enzyme n=1 Tax=Marinibaculum pumilum TaxID=1766165 RepID=A0ABV7KWT9_9PROT